MAGMTATRKRRGDDIESASAKRAAKAAKNGDRFKRKLKRSQYHSDSEEEEEKTTVTKTTAKASAKPGKKTDKKEKEPKHKEQEEEEEEGDDEDDGFTAVDLLDSDNEALDDDALVDDGASDLDGDDDDSDNDSLDSAPSARRGAGLAKKLRVSDAPAGSDDDDDDLSGGDDDDEFDLSDEDPSKPKSKRNDPNTFATSLQKILGTKLSTTRRADPVLARSAEAREASRRVVDAALEEKVRRQMRIERRAALEKGRVKDVLIASNRPLAGAGQGDGEGEGEGETTASILATEKKLRKVAQRGVVQLFNAVRAAQVKATQAKKKTREEGVIGMDKREAKVTEMSRKGFLDLIASGGGGLRKGGLEEA